jgi:hypothetical protein
VSNQIVPSTAPDGLEVPELDVLIADNTLFKSVLNDGKDWLAIL